MFVCNEAISYLDKNERLYDKNFAWCDDLFKLKIL